MKTIRTKNNVYWSRIQFSTQHCVDLLTCVLQNKNYPVAKHCAVNTHRELQLQHLISVRDEGEWAASHPGYFTPVSTHRILRVPQMESGPGHSNEEKFLLLPEIKSQSPSPWHSLRWLTYSDLRTNITEVIKHFLPTK